MNCTCGAQGSIGAEGLFPTTFSIVNTCRFESLKLTKDRFVSFKKVEGLNSMKRRAIKAIERK